MARPAKIVAGIERVCRSARRSTSSWSRAAAARWRICGPSTRRSWRGPSAGCRGAGGLGGGARDRLHHRRTLPLTIVRPRPRARPETLAPACARNWSPIWRSPSRRLQRGLFSGVQRRLREALLRLRFALGDPRREMSDRRLPGWPTLQDRLHSALKIGILRRTQELRRLHDRLDRRDPRQDLSERTRRLGALRVALERAAGRALGLAPRRLAVEQLRARQARAVRERCQRSGEELRVAHARLEAISPQRVFERGYSMTRRAATGKVVRTVGEVSPGDALEIVVRMREEGGELFEEKISAVAKAL